MKTRINLVPTLALALALIGTMSTMAQQFSKGPNDPPLRPKGPCDIYAAAGNPCVAAHSTTRALYASYNGPLYQVLRQSDSKTLDIGIVQPAASPVSDAGGYANAAAQDAFCANTHCWISIVYDQSPKHNDLVQAPRGGFSGPAMGGFNNIPVAEMAPITIMGHKAYGVFIAPGMGLRQNNVKGTAVDDEGEGQYWVINGHHFNSGCCFDYGNAEIDSRDDDNGTMETTYFGDATPWYHGNPPGPWVMTDQENNLVGCVNSDGTKLCANLPNITWRFVTAMAKGEPHHWTSLGGDAQRGALQVMFNGPRVNSTYDPMRKQGAILLGNGGDNSVGSQGTFYEGAMTAANTFPTDDTDQLVQVNVVAAKYDVERLSLAPASATAISPGLQTFSLKSSQNTALTFTNTTGEPVSGLRLSITVPSGWSVVASRASETTKTFTETIAPGASVSATFKITSGPTAYNGDIIGNASWSRSASGAKRTEIAALKVRNVSPIKINELRAGAPANPTNSFIELYNAGTSEVDLSNWTVTAHPTQQTIFSTVKITSGNKLAPGGFYLLGLSDSGLAVPVRSGEATLYVRGVTSMTVGDTVSIDTGPDAETRKIAKLGTPAYPSTTLWQPLPEGPVITIPAGSTNVPVTSTTGFQVGEKIALGYGAIFPSVGLGTEKYEVATVTAVGKQGTEALLAAEASAGSTNLKVTSVANISVGDKIRLDIDSVGHGIETVTVTKIGTQAIRSGLIDNTSVGATNVKVRSVNGFAVGDKVIIGMANPQTVTISLVGSAGQIGTGIGFTPALAQPHPAGDSVVAPGTGVDLAAPLTFTHASNLPFSDRGTGITFEPATTFAHSSNEPVQPLGTGITLDRSLGKEHPMDAVVHDAAVTTAGYQGTPEPSQWFGGPALSAAAGNIVLRDATGLVVDSLNYGLVVDPWSAEGYHGTSGSGQSGCHGPALANGVGFGLAAMASTNRSAGRFPDGADTDSNCADFFLQATTTLPLASTPGATNIKVASVSGFDAGQTIIIDSGANLETAVIASVGTAGATTVGAPAAPGATMIAVASPFGFTAGQTITIDSGSNQESALVASINPRGGTITLSLPLSREHVAGTQVAGTGITLTKGLSRPHASGAQVADNVPTPGASNRYNKKSR